MGNRDSMDPKEPPAGGARHRALTGHTDQSLHSRYKEKCNKKSKTNTATKNKWTIDIALL